MREGEVLGMVKVARWSWKGGIGFRFMTFHPFLAHSGRLHGSFGQVEHLLYDRLPYHGGFGCFMVCTVPPELGRGIKWA